MSEYLPWHSKWREFFGEVQLVLCVGQWHFTVFTFDPFVLRVFRSLFLWEVFFRVYTLGRRKKWYAMVLWNFFSSPSKGTKEITLTACTLANINKQRTINFQHVLTSKSRNLIMRWSQNMQVIVENISRNQREIQMTDLINRSGWDNNTRWCTFRFSLRLYSIGGKPLNCMYSLKWSCNYLCVITSIFC